MTTEAPRTIMHMDLDSFFVSVERLQDSRLNNKPIIIGGRGDRGVVASCSYETRQFGVHSAMPMRMALQLCPQAIVIVGDSERYSRYSHLVTDVVRDHVPLFEKSSIDEFYVDLSGMDRFFGAFKWATELRHKIQKESGLPISFGLSVNKTVSKIATGEAKPDGQRYVEHGTEKLFLSPLPISKIPMIGEKTERALRSMGISTVGALQQMPLDVMEKAFGRSGTVMWQKAQGIDNSPVEPHTARKSISAERTFGQDTIDVSKLKAMLINMTEKLTHQLRTENKLASCVTVKLRYSDFSTYTLQAKIPYTVADHVLIKKVHELFDKLYSKRLLIRLVGLRFSGLVWGGHQVNLFEDTEKTLQLYEAMDHIRGKYGITAVGRAKGFGVNNRESGEVNLFKVA